jgi:hypothetical protein
VCVMSFLGTVTQQVEQNVLLISSYVCLYEGEQSVDTYYNSIENVRRKDLFISFLSWCIAENLRSTRFLLPGMRPMRNWSVFVFTDVTLQHVYEEFSSNTLEYLERFVAQRNRVVS